MLKKSASGVLASRRGSTYQPVRLASSLAAALLDGLFEHPVVVQAALLLRASVAAVFSFAEFFRSLLGRRDWEEEKREGEAKSAGFLSLLDLGPGVFQ
jgi:hypothetical protein